MMYERQKEESDKPIANHAYIVSFRRHLAVYNSYELWLLKLLVSQGTLVTGFEVE
jgi:hypothetical protein